jgi:hypothetical protein
VSVFNRPWSDLPERFQKLFDGGNFISLESVAEGRRLGLQDEDIEWLEEQELDAEGLDAVISNQEFPGKLTCPIVTHFLWIRHV